MDYRAAVDYLLGFADFERSRQADREAGAFALDRINSLLDRLGRPEAGRLTVHVAGSKGKGSVAAMVESILRAHGESAADARSNSTEADARSNSTEADAGSSESSAAGAPSGEFRTGLYSSPHLHEFTERIALDGQELSQEIFAGLVARLQPVVEAELRAAPGRLSTFELLTAMAFLAFRDAAVAAQVIEVGLGGRLDSTNVFAEKAVAVVTAISDEHANILGPEITRIASEKAGIIVPGTKAVVLGPQRSAAAASRVIARAEQLGLPLTRVADDYRWERAGADRHGQWLRIMRRDAAAQPPSQGGEQPGGEPDAGGANLYLLPLMGHHQIENAATALATIDALQAPAPAGQGLKIDNSAVRTGLATVSWPARLELLTESPRLVVDAAHNGESFDRVLESLRDYFPHDRLVVVLGMLRDKDIASVAALLNEHAAALVVTQPDHPRALKAEDLADAFAGFAGPVMVEPTVAEALGAARGLAGEHDVIAVLGSIFLAAEARALTLRQGGPKPTSARAEL